MAIKPVIHRIIVKPDTLEVRDEVYMKASKAGIYVGESEAQREQAAVDTGVVVMVGVTAFKQFGADRPEDVINVGDRVVYAKYAGKAIVDPENKIKHVALNDEDIIAIITE